MNRETKRVESLNINDSIDGVKISSIEDRFGPDQSWANKYIPEWVPGLMGYLLWNIHDWVCIKLNRITIVSRKFTMEDNNIIYLRKTDV